MSDPAPIAVIEADEPGSGVNPSAEVLAKRLRGSRLGVLFLLAVTVGMAYLTRHCLAAANTRMQAELGFNNQQFGYFTSAFSVGYLICQVPGGWLGQRWGTRLTIALLCGLWSCLTLTTGLIVGLPALIAARFGFGLAQAGLIPNQAQILKDWFPESSRGSASAVIVTAMSVGSFLALWLTSRLLAGCDVTFWPAYQLHVVFHWRTLLIAYSIIGVIWSGLFYLVFRSQPHQVQWLRFESSEPVASETQKASMHRANRAEFWIVVGSLSFWGLFVQSTFKAAGYNLLVTFYPAYLELGHGVSAERAGILASWSLVAVFVGSILGGKLVDLLQQRTGSKSISRVGVASVSLLLTAAVMASSSFATNALQVGILIAISSSLMAFAGPCAWAAIADVGGKNTAVVSGFLNMGGALAGIVFAPLIGLLIDTIKKTNGNWDLVIQVHALFYLIAGLSWLVVTLERTPKPLETNNAI
jgi:MFS family permease